MAGQKQQEIYGISDDENPEWTAEDFAKARPFAEIFPELATKRRRMRISMTSVMHPNSKPAI